jgi:class 3 adenylate cyclase
VGTQRAAILGQSDAASIAVLFAAAHPDRTQALVLGNSAARYMAAPDYALGMAESEVRPLQVAVAEAWGTETLAELMAPGGDPALRRWLAKANRLACSQQAVIAHLRRLELLDVREALPVIRIPTLVLHRQGCPIPTLDQGRHLADNIPGARFEAVPGTDTTIWNTPNARILDLIEEFLTGISPHEETDRALAAILFTDIVGSTERAADMGDRRWRALLETHDAVARAIVAQHHGRLVKLTGDGVLATFDGPGRAIRATLAFRDALRSFDIDIRAGLHAGEIELRSDDISGIGVHVAARVLDHADSGELLVSGAVPMLVAGSGIEFDDRGEHELKGIPGVWKLFAVEV